jgi:hypothetical protein
MSNYVILKIKGSDAIFNFSKQELTITDTDVRCEVIQGLKKIQMTLPFDRIARVNVTCGFMRADIEVVNKEGPDNIKVRALLQEEAYAARKIIEEKMRNAAAVNRSTPLFVAEELAKLAKLKRDGILTENEFLNQTRMLLG